MEPKLTTQDPACVAVIKFLEIHSQPAVVLNPTTNDYKYAVVEKYSVNLALPQAVVVHDPTTQEDNCVVTVKWLVDRFQHWPVVDLSPTTKDSECAVPIK